MASDGNKVIRTVKGGERHIYPVFDKNANKAHEQHTSTKSAQVNHAFKPTILDNIGNKNTGTIPKIKNIGPQKHSEKNLINQKHTDFQKGKPQKINKLQDKRCKKRTGLANDKENPKPPITDCVTNPYAVPEIYSTLHVTEALIRARKEQPDLSQLVRNKLDSPNTGTRVKKQVSRKVNAPGQKPVFRELVSVDVSEGDLANQLKDQLNIRAAAVKPSTRTLDPVPKLSDIFNPEDYVTTTSITTAPTYLPYTSVKPRFLYANEFDVFRDYVLGLDYSSIKQSKPS